jgi:hypothetical protein
MERCDTVHDLEQLAADVNRFSLIWALSRAVFTTERQGALDVKGGIFENVL